MKEPYPIVTFSSEGVNSWFLFTSDWMISFLIVLMPMLEKRITKMAITTIETRPPVIELYSV